MRAVSKAAALAAERLRWGTLVSEWVRDCDESLARSQERREARRQRRAKAWLLAGAVVISGWLVVAEKVL